VIPSASLKHVLETEEPLLLKVAEVARLLSVSRSEAYEIVHRHLKPVTLGKSGLRVYKPVLLEWIESQVNR
jgi:predicted DNA-binding transcriptional regulator AlpA